MRDMNEAALTFLRLSLRALGLVFFPISFSCSDHELYFSTGGVPVSPETPLTDRGLPLRVVGGFLPFRGSGLSPQVFVSSEVLSSSHSALVFSILAAPLWPVFFPRLSVGGAFFRTTPPTVAFLPFFFVIPYQTPPPLFL